MPKKRLLLFLFILVSFSLMTYQSSTKHFIPVTFLHSALNSLYELKGSLKNTITAPFRRALIREEENERLKAELAQLQQQRQAYYEALSENKRLKRLLELREIESRYVTSAQVIAKNIDQWSNILTIGKGAKHGLGKNMAAITEKGLVGKLSDVSSSYSQLLLLTDINFSVAVRLQESRTEGVLSGTGFRTCRLKYIPYEKKVENGDVVITSGLDSLFPPGIPVGFISKISKKEVGLFQNIEILPFVDDRTIEVVTIIKRQ
jgi:rod shape-determining protein MreC